ncbi:sigma-54-dependent Fis family transcriptional regulator [Candidatus Sumerlaeota bacterium]|nr:sigma-54-dependent Fis family transcriptional regulator [Candidatus Sumerlaeota bacterium]
MRSSDRRSPSRGSVLVIHCGITPLERISDELTRRDFAVTTAAGGSEGLRALSGGEFDAVLLDLCLPGRGSLQVLEQIAMRHPDLPVVLLSPPSDVARAVDGMRRGACDCLEKSVPPQALERSLEMAMEQGRLRRRSQVTPRGSLRAPCAAQHPVGHSSLMRDLRGMIERVAPTDISVLITGESGTGKEVVARSLVAHSARADQPLFTLNFAAMPASLIESELFGHERGAFTGADQARPGFFELADGGTVFLDEITETPPELQAKLLRVLQFQECRRIGGKRLIPSNVRVVAATNRDPEVEVAAGRFREDLYHRLAAITLRIAPLRERPEDIGPLVDLILSERLPRDTPPPALSEEALACLMRHHWPGNVRELENVLLRASILCEGGVIQPRDLPASIRESNGNGGPRSLPASPDATLGEMERRHILGMLERCGGNKAETARRLGITKRTLYNKLIHYGVHRPEEI